MTMFQSRMLLAAISGMALLSSTFSAQAGCAPDNPGKGDSVVCSGIDADGFSDGSDGLAVSVLTGARVNNDTGRAFELENGVSLTNDGDIISGGDDGINAGDDFVLVNNGQIQSTTADAVNANDNASIINNGTITSSGDDAVQVNGGSTVTNHGTISSTSDEAIEAAGEDNVTVVNTGTIKTETGGDKAVEGNANLTVRNSGQIFSRDGEAIEADADGLILTNSGEIRSLADDAVDGAGNVTISNSGTISGTLNDGIELDSGTVSNSGLIESTSSAPGEVDSGIDFDLGGGTVNNSGTIRGEVGIGTDAANTAVQEIVNTGTIIGTGGTALALYGGNDIVTVGDGAVFAGVIDPGAGEDTLNLLSVEGRILHFASRPETVHSAGQTLIWSGTGLVVVDPTVHAAITPVFATANVAFMSVVRAHAVANPAPLATASTGNPDILAKARGWAAGTAGWSRFGGVGAAEFEGFNGADQGGLTFEGRDGWRAGFFVGGVFASYETSMARHNIDFDGFAGGLHVERDMGDSVVYGILSVGQGTFTIRQRIADAGAPDGLATSIGRPGAIFVSPELGFKAVTAMGERAIEFGASVNYAGLFMNAYRETGVSLPLTYASRDIHQIRANMRVALPFTLGEDAGGRSIVTPFASLHASLFGGDETLFGSSLPGAGASTFTARAGIGFSRRARSGLSFDASLEGLTGSGGRYGFAASAGLRLEF